MIRVAVINEVSAAARNQDILQALSLVEGLEVLNVGMKNPDDAPELTYIHTGIMAGLALEAGACSLVIGGCGTGQGFLNVALQMPGVFCGLIETPLDAWLFSRINAGNCISLALNKGYGWASEINLGMIFQALFGGQEGTGFPSHRADSQAQSREKLKHLSAATHVEPLQLIEQLPGDVLHSIQQNPAYMDMIQKGTHERFVQALLQRLREVSK